MELLSLQPDMCAWDDHIKHICSKWPHTELRVGKKNEINHLEQSESWAYGIKGLLTNRSWLFEIGMFIMSTDHCAHSHMAENELKYNRFLLQEEGLTVQSEPSFLI